MNWIIKSDFLSLNLRNMAATYCYWLLCRRNVKKNQWVKVKLNIKEWITSNLACTHNRYQTSTNYLWIRSFKDIINKLRTLMVDSLKIPRRFVTHAWWSVRKPFSKLSSGLRVIDDYDRRSNTASLSDKKDGEKQKNTP